MWPAAVGTGDDEGSDDAQEGEESELPLGEAMWWLLAHLTAFVLSLALVAFVAPEACLTPASSGRHENWIRVFAVSWHRDP